MERTFVGIGSMMALIAVAAGAFGAHALKERLSPELLATFEVAARYHMYHALGIIAVAWTTSRWPGSAPAGWFFLAGIVIFSGSLYLLAITGHRWLGAVTPLGGLAFLTGWLALAWSAWKAG
jgi:uncharacterized membrane protein YgdD (TMEM256/DUF423 family)